MAKVTKSSDNMLEGFLNELLDLTTQFTEESIKQTSDEDEINVMRAFAPSLIDQISELNGYVTKQTSRASKQQQAEVNNVLRMTSGISLAKNAKGILPSIGSVLGKLGISRIIKEIKKIIRAILDALNIKLPKWIDIILNIIDEIFDAISSAGSAKLATTLSIQEQNYLAELTQLAKLQQANQFKFIGDEDED